LDRRPEATRRAERTPRAKAELETEAKAAAQAKLEAAAAAQQQREAAGRKKSGEPSTTSDIKVQKNVTGPQSRVMESKDGFVQAYNAQIAIDSQAQIIVAQDAMQSVCPHMPSRSRPMKRDRR
jgi:hypothetical protein